MSVLIKGMEMPKSCEVCPLGAEVDTVYETAMGCRINFKMRSKGNYDNRPEWCPLVPVPPHGRLIDSETLKNHEFVGLQADKTISYQMGWNDALMVVAENAPTIIEAEGATK